MNAVKKVALFCALCLCALPLVAQNITRVQHGAGAPTAQSPVPDCSRDRVWVDDTTGDVWGSVGSPCAWSQGSGMPNLSAYADNIPSQLTTFTAIGTPIMVHDGNSWDANGIGAPERPLFINGEYWSPVAGYSTSALSSAQAIGLFHGLNLGSMVMYSGNPIFTNTIPGATCTEAPTWVASGPTSNPATVIHMYIPAYLGTCDSESAGNVTQYEIHTTVSAFPGGWSSPVAVYPLPTSLKWQYRFRPVYFNGTYYVVMNAGDSSSHPVVVELSSTSPTGPFTLLGTILTNSESWCTGNEVQEPTLAPSLTGNFWILAYGCDAQADNVGLALATSPTGPFTPWSGNPVTINGQGGAGKFYLPTIWSDTTGQWWLMTGDNNVSGIFLSRGTVTPIPNSLTQPVTFTSENAAITAVTCYTSNGYRCTNGSGVFSFTVGASPPSGVHDLFQITWTQPLQNTPVCAPLVATDTSVLSTIAESASVSNTTTLRWTQVAGTLTASHTYYVWYGPCAF